MRLSATTGLLGFFLVLVSPTMALSAPPVPGMLRVVVESLRSSNGKIGCSLFRSEEGFPGEIRKSFKAKWVRIKQKHAVCTFKELKPGTYAVSIFHDENNDSAMEKNFLGIPQEGWAVSRNASASFGPPEWEDARFRYDGRDTKIRVRMNY